MQRRSEFQDFCTRIVTFDSKNFLVNQINICNTRISPMKTINLISFFNSVDKNPQWKNAT